MNNLGEFEGKQLWIYSSKTPAGFFLLDFYFYLLLSLGQTSYRCNGSSWKLNLRWVAKRTRKYPYKYSQVTKKDNTFQGRGILYLSGK